MPERNLYLNNAPLKDAVQKYFTALEGLLNLKYEEIAVENSLDRITHRAVYASCSSPTYNAAAMDGIAVCSVSTIGASENRPLTLHCGNVHENDKSYAKYIQVNTGDPVLPPWDAVIMAEDITPVDENSVQIREAAAAWQHIRPIGEDIVSGEMILPGKRRIRPIDIGVLLSGGVTRIETVAKPQVAVLPTGNEFIQGKIIESNSRMLAAQVERDGGKAHCFPPIPDDFQRLRDAICSAAEKYDLVLVNAGSSAGTEDYTVQVLREIGEVIVHGAAIKPGKPVILAIVRSKPVIGIPGYPVSAYLDYELFARPLVEFLAGQPKFQLPLTCSENDLPLSGLPGAAHTEAVIAKRIVSSLKYREYVRVRAGKVDGKLVAAPLARGAGAAMSLVRADGFCVIEQNSEGIEAGQTAAIELYSSTEEIDRTVLVMGSHDLLLDIIADTMITESRSQAFLASTHVGSMAGLMALKRGECHITPAHLLDEETGSYNIPYIKRLFPGTPMILIKGVGRIQGLMVKKGNPLNINSVADLVRCRYINRQRGAGTRLLLDLMLKQAEILPEQINGYEREAATHMAAAAAVAGNSADTALGIFSAASALKLDFIPIGNEEYDFITYPRFLQLPHVNYFLEILKNKNFYNSLEELGAYTWTRCGEIIHIE